MGNSSIVYIEDEPDFQKLVSIILGEVGYSVQVAGTGAEGVKLLRRVKPRLLILDINLPDTDGFTICEELRKDPAWHDLIVLMLTVRRRPEEWLKGFASGANDYVSKPLNPPDFLERIKACIEGRVAVPIITPEDAEYQLIQAAIKGNRGAYDALVRKYHGPLLKSISQQMVNKAEAEDIVSSTFMIAYEHMKDFRGDSSFQTYLYGIALRQLKRHWREVKAAPTVDILGGEEGEWIAEPDAELERLACEPGVPRIKDVVRKVPRRYRKILEWSVLRGMKNDEIAQRLAVRNGTVCSRLDTAKRILRNAWQACAKNEKFSP